MRCALWQGEHGAGCVCQAHVQVPNAVLLQGCSFPHAVEPAAKNGPQVSSFHVLAAAAIAVAS